MSAAESFVERVSVDSRRLDRIRHNERLVITAGELRNLLEQAFEAGERRGQNILQQIAEGVHQ